jgi:hypothetical protein
VVEVSEPYIWKYTNGKNGGYHYRMSWSGLIESGAEVKTTYRRRHIFRLLLWFPC